MKKLPSQWIRRQDTKELIHELSVNMHLGENVINSVKGGKSPGTFAHELLAISYAGWINPKFQLQVNQVFLDYKTGKLKPQVSAIDVITKIDRIKNPALQQLAAEHARVEYGLDIPTDSLMVYGKELKEFWQIFQPLGEDQLNHSRSSDRIAININHVMAEAAKHNINLPPHNDLCRILRHDPQFYRHAPVNSSLWNKTVKCWLFRRY